MIPWVVARELRATLLDYLRSTWSLGDPAVEEALFSFLAGPNGLFQGPYLRLGLPFATAGKEAALPLDIAPPYPPHQHQLEAWQRLSSRGQTPQATLITTGTGSGKTECFLYPVLDHALRARLSGKAGIKTIVLYPMNALAADQAARFAETIEGDARLRGRLRVGLFVGGKGQHREMGRDHVIDDNDRLRADPPDILLTNYRMLDLLLQRPKDAPLWKHNEPDTLRYLVLDELHTYDGAQGTDVACLIRRLGQVLGSGEGICPVGTSATVGGGETTRAELLRFASTLFDQVFPPEAFVGETRVPPRELLPPEVLAEAYPPADRVWPEPGDAAEAHVAKVARAFFPPEAATEIFAPQDPASEGRLDRVALGRWTLRLPIVRALLSAAHHRPLAAGEVEEALARALPAYAEGARRERSSWLSGALSLLSFSQRPLGKIVLPLVSVQTTLWVREVRSLLSRVGAAPAFRFYDDAPPPDHEAWAPRYACRDCGHSGWLVTESGPGDALGLAYKDVARAFGERSADLRMVHADEALAREQADAEAPPREALLDAKARRFLEKRKPEDPEAPRVFVHEPDGTKARCPACGTSDGLRMLAARSTTLSSVAVGHLFTTPLNTDRKLLTFSDSVQDAAHRAGFYGARTYRFALRSAILAAVPRDGARIPLAALGPATWSHWLPKLARPGRSAEAQLAALLLPVDLHWLASVEDWHERLDEYVRSRQRAEAAGEASPLSVPEPGPQLLADVQDRLRWECTREVGVATRIGRTLEQSACVSVTVDEERFARAVDDAREILREKVGLPDLPSRAAIATFLAGVVTRLRLRGGVWDRMLEPYLRAGGTTFMLTKRHAPLLSPFSNETSKPLFLTNAPRPKHFDSICSGRVAAWPVDWAVRALGIAPDPALSAEIWLAVVPALARAGILQATDTDEKSPIPGKKATAWGLVPAALQVSRAHAARRCDRCGGELPVVEGSPTDLLDRPCLRFRCQGTLRAIPARPSAPPEVAPTTLPSSSYYRRFYERETLGRLWSKEHTGLLARGPREELELEFKQQPRPDSPNLLSCTPTLEMGIDIGDLSATLLCSVPPAAANYVQRVGRAGRKTGNALVLAFAATRPHDLYFFQEPLEAMAGAISPPGCYLSAPEVLKRQALAFVFDGFARDGGKLQGRVGDALKGEEAKRFPRAVLEFVGARRTALRDAFLEMFRGHEVTAGARKVMSEAFEKDADGLSTLERALVRTTEETRRRRDDLRQLVQKLDERLKQLDTDPVEANKLADLDAEKRALRDERAFVVHQLMALTEQDIWGWLCEESLLPNYAFPERGVKLDAYIQREGTGKDPEHHAWVRAPSAALTELAPFNTFYASARRVVVDGVDLKKESPPVAFRFCPSCHHSDAHKSVGEPEPACPRCGDPRWADVGQRRKLVFLGQVFAVARHRDAVLGDDGEDRARAYYEKVALFEAEALAKDAWSNEAAGFGFELQPAMKLRELNLGKRDDASGVAPAHVAGLAVPDVAFLLCPTCGQARAADEGRAQSRGGPPRPRHRAWCPERKKPEDKQVATSVHLARELTSEALRLVVPFVGGEDIEADLANLRAALRVGLRRFYGGDPDFLDVYAYDEPLPAREGRRRFLVVLDRVPGGTGLLAELCREKGAKLKEALLRAHEVLARCACQKREPAVKACYQCLYAYRDGGNLPVLDRARGVEIVEQLLEAFEGLALVDSIGTMSQSGVLESELEARFVRALEHGVRDVGGTWERRDEGAWRLTVGKRGWLLRAQVELLGDKVRVPCRADFVLYPEEPGKGVRPVAVFTDGLAYHVMPGQAEARLADDARKRLGISDGGEMLSWSLTWKDVTSPEAPPVPTWIGEGARFATLQSLAFKLDQGAKGEKLEGLLRVLDADPLRGLLGYLAAPTRLGDLAALAGFVLLQTGGKRQPGERVQSAHEAWRAREVADDVALGASEGDTATVQLALGEHARLLASVPQGKLGTLVATPASASVTLRLEDDAPSRGAASYEASWRLWLRAWNLLQALPEAALVTRAAAAPALMRASARPAAPAPAAAASRKLVTVAQIEDATARAAIAELLTRHPALAEPVVPFELRAPSYPVDDDLELAWPAKKVAAYFDHQSATAAVLRDAGWKVLALERGLTVDDLEAALGLGRRSEGTEA